MVRGPTEVVYQVRLPDGDLARLSQEQPALRVLLTPLASNGTGYPSRFLFSAANARDVAAIANALTARLRDVRELRRTDDALDVVGTLDDDARALLDGTLGAATAALGPDIVHRPGLIRNGWLHAGALVMQVEGVEGAIARLSELLKARGVDARLGRIAAARSEHWPVGTYEDALTPKQDEMLRLALALGLYDTPRRCTLDTLADIFGISKAAAHNRMKGAERKILARYFE